MPKVKLNDLSGLALNYAVAITQGWELERPQDGQMFMPGRSTLLKYYGPKRALLSDELDYSGSWAACGPLIDKYKIELLVPKKSTSRFIAVTLKDIDGREHYWRYFSYSAREAICRAVVGLHMGDTVDIPGELLTNVL